MSALKSVFIIFCIGIISGLLISPYANTRPEDLLLTPTNDLFAKEPMPTNTILKNKQSNKTDYLTSIYSKYDQEQKSLLQDSVVLGVQATNENKTQTETKQVPIITNSKVIALFGDSMIDTMETNAPYLQRSINNAFPNIKISLLNYGIGAQTVVQGLARLHDPLNYKDRNYNPILESGADIFIIDSFAYNPMSNIDEFENKLNDLMNQFKSSGKTVYLLATIAPLKSNFGKGPGGVNWDSDTSWTHATKIQAHIEKAISVAQSLDIPVIDCYHSTLQANGEGNINYVNKHDGIHPSISGHQYIANTIANMIQF